MTDEAQSVARAASARGGAGAVNVAGARIGIARGRQFAARMARRKPLALILLALVSH